MIIDFSMKYKIEQTKKELLNIKKIYDDDFLYCSILQSIMIVVNQ